MAVNKDLKAKGLVARPFVMLRDVLGKLKIGRKGHGQSPASIKKHALDLNYRWRHSDSTG